MTAGDRLYGDPELVRFYDLENAGGDDLAFCRVLAADAGSVLDLGCGTGAFLASLDGPSDLAGVDPAAAMLAVARDRPGGGRVAWIEGDARTVRLGRQFDLVVLTGHAFQVFLGEDDQRAVLDTIAAHLAPAGRFVFDSRNPLAGEWRDWVPEMSRRQIEDPELGAIDAWNDVACDPSKAVATYQTHYRCLADGRCWSASSQIGFTGRDDLARLIGEAGLVVERWLGDWTGAAMEETSPEMIPIGALRR